MTKKIKINSTNHMELSKQEFYDEIVKADLEENRQKERLFKYIKSAKGTLFFEDLMTYINDCCYTSLFEIVRTTEKGKLQKEDNYEYIKKAWIYQYSNGGYTGDEFAGYVYIQLKKDRYLKFHYSM